MKSGRPAPTNRPLKLNEGAQARFVLSDARHAAYMGGIGAGKTYAMILRGLRFTDQPTVPGEFPPKVAFLAKSERKLKDDVLPPFRKIQRQVPKLIPQDGERKSDLAWDLAGGQEILFRSLDDPDSIRGIEIVAFGVDEGRLFDSDYAYKIMLGRLRQGVNPDLFESAPDDVPDDGYTPGHTYRHAGWVCSTTHGYDWMYYRFHPDSDKRKPDTELFNAPTYENRRNLPPEYLRDLESEYEGRFFKQEVLGDFVGVVSGAVFDSFDEDKHVRACKYDPNLPFFSFWDFGIGDAGVCLFAQMDSTPKVLPDYQVEMVPALRIVGYIEMKDATSKQWAQAYYRWLERNTADERHPHGRRPDSSWGDPAGVQRNSAGTSWLTALAAEGIDVYPAPKRPKDEAIIMLQNLMEGIDRFTVDDDLERVIHAIISYHWKVNEDGEREGGSLPVHDWTSHFCDALQYGALGVLSLFPQRRMTALPHVERGTFGFLESQLLGRKKTEEVHMGMDLEPRGRLDWHPDKPVKWDDFLDEDEPLMRDDDSTHMPDFIPEGWTADDVWNNR